MTELICTNFQAFNGIGGRGRGGSVRNKGCFQRLPSRILVLHAHASLKLTRAAEENHTQNGAGSFLPTPCAAPAPKCKALQDGPRASHLKPFRLPGAPRAALAVPRLTAEQPLVTWAWRCWQHRQLCFRLTAS